MGRNTVLDPDLAFYFGKTLFLESTELTIIYSIPSLILHSDHVPRARMFASVKTLRSAGSWRFVRIGRNAQGCRSSNVEAASGTIDAVGVDGRGNEKSKVRALKAGISFCSQLLFHH